MKKAYRCRIYPNKTQQQLLHKNFGCVRFVHNHLLDAVFTMRQWKHPSKVDMVKSITTLKELYPFLKEVDSISLQATAEAVDDAFQRWFSKQNGKPNFKKKKQRASYTTKCSNNNIRFEGKRLRLPKIGTITIKDSFGLQGKRIRRATVSYETNGHYYVSLLVEEDIEPLPKTNKSIGLDMGIATLAARSDGKFISSLKALMKYENKLIKAQRTLSRRMERAKKEGRSIRDSKNIAKARKQVAHVHAKIKHVRHDYLHKQTKELVTNFDVIKIEKLKVKNMLKNKNLAKHIQDASWGTFFTMLAYKAAWYGKEIVKVKAAYTSQTCFTCKHIDSESRKGIRFCCTNCGHVDHADTNAALNILHAV